jgi:hypothetical protein
MFSVRQPEFSLLVVDGTQDHFCLRSPWRAEFTNALLKLTIGGFEYEEDVVGVWLRIVRALMPALGTLLQRFHGSDPCSPRSRATS